MLSSIPDVQRCAVVAREDGNGDKCLVAYVVQNPRGHVGRSATFLSKCCLEHDTGICNLDKLLLTPNGKLDRSSAAPTQRTAALYAAPAILSKRG